MRECSRCHESKPLAKGHTWCKDCDSIRVRTWYRSNQHQRKTYEQVRRETRTPEEAAQHRAYQKAWYRNNPDKVKAQRLKKYGLSLEEFRARLEAQGGLCAICRIAPAEAVDHDHATRQVRGLLCHHCNHGLGKFRENVTILENAIRYLTPAGRPATPGA